MSYSTSRLAPVPVWGWLLCDTHAIVEVLVRYGRGQDRRVQVALAQMGADLALTAQGRARPCIPHSATGFRGPGRRMDLCPQLTLEALRTFGRLPAHRQPDGLLETARVLLRVWQRRGTEKPYMFGHGLDFKTIKWPPAWYGVASVLDAVGRYPALWHGADAKPADRRAFAELAACLVVYNVDARGRVTPRAVFRWFEEFSFGQKAQPSAFAIAQVLTILRHFDELTADIRAVDVRSLGSSRAGTGAAQPPRLAGRTAWEVRQTTPDRQHRRTTLRMSRSIAGGGSANQVVNSGDTT